MERPTTKNLLRGLILTSLCVGPVGCFIVCGAGRASTAHQLRPGEDRRVGRPLQLALHPPRRACDDSALRFRGRRRAAGWAKADSIDCSRQGFRLSAAAGEPEPKEEWVIAKEKREAKEVAEEAARVEKIKVDTKIAKAKASQTEIEKNYTPEEREFVTNFYAELESSEEPKPEDERAVYAHDYKMYKEGQESLDIEWDACVGKFDTWDLPPFEDYDPKVLPLHYKYYEDDLQANLRSEVNPFPLHSEWVDREIKVGEIDEAKKEAIEPMMSVIEQVCELIDTTDDVFSFKYVGPIKHKKGIASWAMVLIKRLYPEVKGVEFVTNRTRDRTDW